MTRSSAIILLVAIAVVGGGLFYIRSHHNRESAADAARAAAVGCSQVRAAFQEQRSNDWISMTATVVRLLPDESGQYRHQRFIVRCPGGLTVLVVNDISIGQRVPVAPRTSVGIRGQYVWNAQGGLVHFTHHDPAGGTGGWILFRRRVYSLGRSDTAAYDDVGPLPFH